MKAEYDFSKGTRGKFYHPNAVFSFPVYLEPDVNDFIELPHKICVVRENFLGHGLHG